MGSSEGLDVGEEVGEEVGCKQSNIWIYVRCTGYTSRIHDDKHLNELTELDGVTEGLDVGEEVGEEVGCKQERC